MGDAAMVNGETALSETLNSASRNALQKEPPAAEEGKCGYGRCVPNCLQKFHKPPWLLASMCFMIVAQGFVVTGITGSVISTLERRFHLTSIQTGLMAAMYDISVTLVLIPVTYYGGFQHKGKWLGFGCIILGIGCFVMIIPQFTTGIYQVRSTNVKRCSGTSVDCSGEEDLSYYLYVFLLGQFLLGLGSSPMFSLAFVYLDENLSRDSSALYIGIYYCISVFGPAAGFLLGGYFLGIYGDIGYVDLNSLTVTKDDPLWYGAWWLGFMISGLMAFIAAFPLLCFAREIPGAALRRQRSKKEADEHSENDVVAQAGFGTKLKDLPAAVKNIFKIPTFTLLALCDSFEALAVAGAGAFMPKYIETQYGLSAGLASIVAGAVMVPAGGGGCFFSGFVIKRWKLDCRKIMKFAYTVLIISALSTLALLAGCPTRDIAGITVPYFQNESLSLSSSCHAGCGCMLYAYDPVCAGGKTEYLTPCYAGCTNVSNGVYSNCQCLGANQTIKSGTCPATCNYLPIFLIFLFLIIFFGLSASTPTVQATLRCVPFKQRALATGISWIFVRSIGAIPSPLIFGALLDSVCLQWGKRCKKRTSCQIYANTQATYIVMGGILTCKIIAIIFMVLASVMYKPPKEDVPLQEKVPMNGESNVLFKDDEVHVEGKR